MKKSKQKTLVSIGAAETIPGEPQPAQRFWTTWSGTTRFAAIAVCLLLAAGTFGATLKYLEESAREQKLGAKNSANNQPASLLNSINPFVEPPLPTPAPQLSKEYIYAGSRMLAIEDANASAAPPADLAVWRPSTGYWYVLGGQGSQQTQLQWGSSGDKTVPGDYDGDGKTDFSVFRPSTGSWYIVRSSDGSNFAYSFGQSGDIPAQADYDGDGKTDAAIVRPDYPTTGLATWFIQYSSTNTFTGYQYGNTTDIPAPGDFDGDGRADIAVWRAAATANFYYLTSSTNYTASPQTITLGQTGDVPVVGDYDGDGRADAAVRHGNDWVIKQSSDNSTQTVPWQYSTDQAVQNDYDGDGKVDIAVWRESIGYWLIRQSSRVGQTDELRQVQWGGVGDIPVPAFYRR